MAWAAVAGGIISAMGAVHKAQANSRRKDQLNQLSELEGVDVNDAVKESLDVRQGNFQQASQIAAQQNAFDQAELDKMLEASIPGYKKMQGQRISNAQMALEGQLPQEEINRLFRRSNSRAVGGGYGGTQAGRNLELRDLGIGLLDYQDRGQRYVSSIVGSTPMAQLSSTRELSGVNPGDVLGLRSKERTEKIGLKLKYIGQPGATDAHAEYDTQLGGSLMGYGLNNMGEK